MNSPRGRDGTQTACAPSLGACRRAGQLATASFDRDQKTLHNFRSRLMADDRARDVWRLVDRFRGDRVASKLDSYALLERLLAEQCEIVKKRQETDTASISRAVVRQVANELPRPKWRAGSGGCYERINDGNEEPLFRMISSLDFSPQVVWSREIHSPWLLDNPTLQWIPTSEGLSIPAMRNSG